MKDGFGREIDYMRVSLTDRCNYRCRYCMRQEGVDKKDHADILTLEQVYEVVKAFSEMGGRKVRFTGGEPLVRKNALSLIERVDGELGLEQIGLTTNGVYLPGCIERLAKAGVNAINVSIDTLDPGRYRFVTMGGDLKEALAGLQAALERVPQVKINAVLMQGINDEEVKRFADFAQEHDAMLRFIELMPFAEGNAYQNYGISANEIIDRYHLKMVETKGNAEFYAFEDGTEVGFIRPLSHKFCSSCNRLRLTSDGKLLPCLHGDQEIDVKPYLAQGNIKAALEDAILAKPPCHQLDKGQLQSRKMNYIGG